MADRQKTPVIFNWDDNFAPVLVSLVDAVSVFDFGMTVPPEFYVQLTSVNFRYTTNLAGINRGIWIEVHRGQHKIWISNLIVDIKALTGWDVTFFVGSALITQLLPFAIASAPLPHYLRLIPGDTIHIHTIQGNPGDRITDIHMYFDKYNLR